MYSSAEKYLIAKILTTPSSRCRRPLWLPVHSSAPNGESKTRDRTWRTNRTDSNGVGESCQQSIKTDQAHTTRKLRERTACYGYCVTSAHAAKGGKHATDVIKGQPRVEVVVVEVLVMVTVDDSGSDKW